jgi:hypothetical protein
MVATLHDLTITYDCLAKMQYSTPTRNRELFQGHERIINTLLIKYTGPFSVYQRLCWSSQECKWTVYINQRFRLTERAERRTPSDSDVTSIACVSSVIGRK